MQLATCLFEFTVDWESNVQAPILVMVCALPDRLGEIDSIEEALHDPKTASHHEEPAICHARTLGGPSSRRDPRIPEGRSGNT